MATTQVRCSNTLFNNPLLSDVKLKQIYNRQTREYLAHKAILCFQSGYFMKALTGSFKEANEDTVTLSEDHADHFEFVLKYLYSLHFDSNEIAIKVGANSKLEQMQFIMGVYTVADKYDIERLTNPTKENLKAILEATKEPEVLSSIVNTHYTEYPDPGHAIGNLISSTLLDTHDQFTKSKLFKDLCRDFPPFAADIMGNTGCFECWKCSKTNFVGSPPRTRVYATFNCSYCDGKGTINNSRGQ